MGAASEIVVKKYKLVPPDGGWGYMICIAVIINFAITTGIQSCFGLMYNDLFVKIGMGSTMITLLSGSNIMISSIFGFLASPLLHVVTFRRLALVAAIMYNVGQFGIIFVKSIVQFFICYSLIQSTGYGIMYNLTYTIINDYFVEKRLLIISISQTAVAITCMFTPKLVEALMALYGNLGCLMLASAVSMQLFVAVVLMQPVKWHMKKIMLLENNEEKMTLLAGPDGDKTNVVILSDLEAPRKPSIVVDVNEHLADKKKSIFRIVINELFDKTVMKILFTSVTIIGPAFSFFCDFTFSTILPQALYSLNWKQEYVAWGMSAVAIGDMVARAMFIVFNTWLYRIGIQKLYIIGLVIAITSRIGMMLSSDTMYVLGFLSMIGVGRCFVIVLASLVIVDVVDDDKFTAANGIFMLTVGVICFVLSPAIGAVRDISGSYTLVFSLLAGALLLIAIIWTIELYYKKSTRKNSQR
ncbi:monocarboxylate transporter 7 [Aphomia sociella]